jgi:transposase
VFSYEIVDLAEFHQSLHMPYRKISRDLKIAAMNLYEQQLILLDDILDCVGFSERTFYRILRLWRETGDVVKHGDMHGLCGRPRLLAFDDVQYLLRLVRHRPDWFIDELANLLQENRFISVHFTTIARELGRAGYSIKKLKRIAAERSDEKRAAYVYHIAQYTDEQLGFIDETSKDEKTPGRRRGRAKRGRRAQRRQVFIRGCRLSGTGLLTVDGMVTSTVVEGSMTTASFCEFLEENVVSNYFTQAQVNF